MITNYGITHPGNVINAKYGKNRLLTKVPVVNGPHVRIQVAYLYN